MTERAASVGTASWEPWQREYEHGAWELFPPDDVTALVDELRERFDPISAAICGAHVSLSEPLPDPLRRDQLEELACALADVGPIELRFGPVVQLGPGRGIVYAIGPAEPFLELRRKVHATSVFAGRPLPRATRPPHLTIAEFIDDARSDELLAELSGAPTGAFRCDEIVLARPDASFRFHSTVAVPLGGGRGSGPPQGRGEASS